MKKILIAAITTLVIFIGSASYAYQIIPNSIDSINEKFTMMGLKDYINIEPGGSVTKDIVIASNYDKPTKFKIRVAGLSGSDDPKNDGMSLDEQGDDSNVYSLKDFIYPEISEFTLNNKEKIIIPVTISIPEGTRPGGLYGAVVVSALPGESTDDSSSGSKTSISPGIAHNYYIRVGGGDVIEDGIMTSFKTSKSFYEKGPVKLETIFENNGNVHLTPYGTIIIKNILGSTIEEIVIEPYSVLPDAVKLKTIDFNKKNLLGKYTAEIKLNRGYTDTDDTVDTAKISFWVLPWKTILILLAIIIIIIWLITAFIAQYKLALLKRK